MSTVTGWGALQDSNTTDKVGFTKFEAGVVTEIRCLGNEPVVRWSHFLPIAKRSITCLGKGCPVCDARELAKAQGVDPKFSTSKKFAMVIYNFKTGQVEILEQGKSFFEQLYSLHTEVGDLTGYNIKVKRVGEKTNTMYTLIPCAPSTFSEEVGELPDLEKQFTAPTREQALALMEGQSPQEVFGKKVETTEDEHFEV